MLDGHPGRAGERRRVEYAPGVPARAAGLPVDVRHVRRQRAGGPRRTSTTRPSSQRAVDLARGADVAVVVVGEWQNMIGEAASRSSLELPGRQLELLQAVVETGTPVVLLVMNGRPLDLRWAAEHVPAILDIWYPGHAGRRRRREPAVRRRLAGRASCRSPGRGRSGRCRWSTRTPRSHEPENQGERYWDEESTPLFPFGHGLSYARFEYGEPRARPRRDRRRTRP